MIVQNPHTNLKMNVIKVFFKRAFVFICLPCLRIKKVQHDFNHAALKFRTYKNEFIA